jgi:DNA-binding NtrC family response regulator
VRKSNVSRLAANKIQPEKPVHTCTGRQGASQYGKADPLLARQFVQQFNEKHEKTVRSVGAETLRLFKRYAWPGNVRELRNVVEHAVILAKTGQIEPCHVPLQVQKGFNPECEPFLVVGPGTTVAEAEKRLILQTLKQTNNNKAEAARQLGLDVKTIRNKLRTYALDRRRGLEKND